VLFVILTTEMCEYDTDEFYQALSGGNNNTTIDTDNSENDNLRSLCKVWEIPSLLKTS
jgi:hypothetical protein